MVLRMVNYGSLLGEKSKAAKYAICTTSGIGKPSKVQNYVWYARCSLSHLWQLHKQNLSAMLSTAPLVHLLNIGNAFVGAGLEYHTVMAGSSPGLIISTGHLESDTMMRWIVSSNFREKRGNLLHLGCRSSIRLLICYHRGCIYQSRTCFSSHSHSTTNLASSRKEVKGRRKHSLGSDEISILKVPQTYHLMILKNEDAAACLRCTLRRIVSTISCYLLHK